MTISALIVGALFAGLAVLPAEAFFSTDEGVKFIQLRAGAERLFLRGDYVPGLTTTPGRNYDVVDVRAAAKGRGAYVLPCYVWPLTIPGPRNNAFYPHGKDCIFRAIRRLGGGSAGRRAGIDLPGRRFCGRIYSPHN